MNRKQKGVFILSLLFAALFALTWIAFAGEFGALAGFAAAALTFALAAGAAKLTVLGLDMAMFSDSRDL
jgi:hypothetical protein